MTGSTAAPAPRCKNSRRGSFIAVTPSHASSFDHFIGAGEHPPFAYRAFTEYWRSEIPLVDFDIGRPDHLAPLLGFGGDESSEIGGRARERCRTQIGEPRLYLGFG